MDSATLIRSLETFSLPPFVIVDYKYDMGSSASAYFSIDLPALSVTDSLNTKILRNNLAGKSYAIDLSSFSISCDSTDFDVTVLTKEGESYIDTMYSILKYEELNKNTSDLFDRFIIRNEDDPIQNKLYIKVTNNSGSAGNVFIQLIYTTLQSIIPV